jgi:CheY-like chemotaxis protein
MDLEMPIMDGLSASREIRSLEEAGKLTQRIEIIAITANVRKGQVDRALDAGIDAIMAKPFLVSDLLETIKTRLGR